MKKNILIILFCLILPGCKSPEKAPIPSLQQKLMLGGASLPAYSAPDVISIDTANKMLSSYLNSINYSTSDSNLKSVSFNAALLRGYLDSITGSGDIVSLKFMFAHTLSYINAGHANQYAGVKSGALTIIIAGYKANGDYVYFTGNTVIDNSIPCPTNCPPGSAGNALFPQ